MARSSCSVIDRHRVDDADDCGVDGRAFFLERLARRVASEDDQVVQRLHEQQLRALERAVLLRRHDGADHSTDLHGRRAGRQEGRKGRHEGVLQR